MFQIGNGGWYPIQKSRKRDPEQIAFPFPCGILLSINHKIRKVLKKWQKYIDKIDLYLTVRNVACFTKYSGLNPEVNVNGLDPGYEWFNNIYPETRRYTVGMKIQF